MLPDFFVHNLRFIIDMPRLYDVLTFRGTDDMVNLIEMHLEARKHIDAVAEASTVKFLDTSKERHSFVETRRKEFGLSLWSKEQCINKFDKMKSEFKVCVAMLTISSSTLTAVLHYPSL